MAFLQLEEKLVTSKLINYIIIAMKMFKEYVEM